MSYVIGEIHFHSWGQHINYYRQFEMGKPNRDIQLLLKLYKKQV